LEVSEDLFDGTATREQDIDDLTESLKKIGKSLNEKTPDSANKKRVESIDLIPTSRLPEAVREGIDEINKMKIIYDDNSEPRRERKQKGPKIKISLESIKAAKEKEERRKLEFFQGRDFYAKLNDQKKAEEELTRKFSKEDFTKLQVIGQFNRGFIIVTVGSIFFSKIRK
jgi:DNA mismatch repair ATPase MutL